MTKIEKTHETSTTQAPRELTPAEVAVVAGGPRISSKGGGGAPPGP